MVPQIKRSSLRTEPTTLASLQPIRARIGMLNTTSLDNSPPRTLQLVSVQIDRTAGGWVETEIWEVVA